MEFHHRSILLPNGVRADTPLLSHPGAAAVVPVVDGRTIVLIHQYRPAVDQYVWEVPAGKLAPGEKPVECAHRELREEVGLVSADLSHLGSIWMEPGYTDEVMYIYLARQLSTVDHQREADEIIAEREIDLDDAVDLVCAEPVWDAKTVVALNLARSRLNQPANRSARR
jgi:ADP-ribose pyrophosphatase